MGSVVGKVAGTVLTAGLTATLGPAGFIAGQALASATGFGTVEGYALSKASGLLNKTPKASLSSIERLNASVNPSAPRKMVFGRTAMATDIRYIEPGGAEQEYIDYSMPVTRKTVRKRRKSATLGPFGGLFLA